MIKVVCQAVILEPSVVYEDVSEMFTLSDYTEPLDNFTSRLLRLILLNLAITPVDHYNVLSLSDKLYK